MIKLNSAVLLLAIILGSCAGIKIESFQAKGVDLKKYKTYAWGKPGNQAGDPTAETRQEEKTIYSDFILELANAELLKKGFVLDTLNPEAIFVFNARTSQRTSYNNSNINMGLGHDGMGYYGGGFWGGGFYSPYGVGGSSHRVYEEGLLYIDMLDTKTKVPLWGGWAKKKLSPKSDVQSIIRKAVKSILVRLQVQHKVKN